MLLDDDVLDIQEQVMRGHGVVVLDGHVSGQRGLLHAVSRNKGTRPSCHPPLPGLLPPLLQLGCCDAEG